MSRERAPVFAGRKAADSSLDLGGLTARPAKPKPPVDPAALAEVAERHGFTDRDSGGQVGAGEGGGLAAPPASPPASPQVVTVPVPASAAPGRRVLRSGRNVPVNLKATPDFQARFFAVCDRLTEIHGRPITQAEGFEMAIAALEREVAEGGAK
ncbi:hypothetical protein RM53_14325 [Brevundimonas nasdae]|uniref:Stability/partitioning determinant n=1 Tax=Brevundimonas nasdae TaxID=172043 RepID=A0A0B4C4C9_9CAUL|nr:hypothetical protein [Brevundimonas nasdae]KIC55889.1 hypothetical protein RM53_14325 [Brevundimonas nasdae]